MTLDADGLLPLFRFVMPGLQSRAPTHPALPRTSQARGTEVVKHRWTSIQGFRLAPLSETTPLPTPRIRATTRIGMIIMPTWRACLNKPTVPM